MNVTFSDGSTEQYQDTPLTSGAQGEIFLSQDQRSAIKLYFPDKTPDADHIQRIETLIHTLNPTRGDLYWTEFFTWPEKRVTQPRLGFRMRFAGGLKTLENYYLQKSYNRLKSEEKGWFIGRMAVAIKLVSAANRLSSMGLCYPDFSGKNILVEPYEGRMVMIDCDSLTVPGKLSATVEGTSYFRAPEIVMRTVREPSVLTDRHAMAVLLYHWLLLWHPLQGDKHFDPDPDKDDQLRYGQNALYVEHPTDTSNRANGQYFKARMLGPEMEKLFQTAFVAGLHNPNRRPLPYEWQQALYHTYDQIIPCTSQHCTWRFFVATPTPRLTCPACQTPLKYPRTLPFVYLLRHRGTKNPEDYIVDQTKAHYVVGWPGRHLYQWHLRMDASPIYADPRNAPDTTPRAVFEYDHRTGQWYLKNLSQHDMYYRTQGDAADMWRLWSPQVSMPLESGVVIQLGNSSSHFRAGVTLAQVG